MADRKHSLGPIRRLFLDANGTLRQVVEGANGLKPFENAWNNLLPEPARDHIRPAYFIDSKLTLWVDSPVWGNWIRHRRDSLVAGIEKQGLPKVHTLIVRLSPETYSNRQTPNRELPGEDVQKIISKTARDIDEPEIRESLEKLARTLLRSD